MKDKLKRYVESFNFLAIGNFFAKPKKQESPAIEFELFELAANKFLESDERNLTNSYQTLMSILTDFLNPLRKEAYSELNPEQKNFLNCMFDIVARKAEVSTNSLSQAQQEIIGKLEAKIFLIEEKQSFRKLYNRLDDIIQKDLVWAIKYPENSTFIKRMLSIPTKKSSKEIVPEVMQNIDAIIDSIEKQIKQDRNLTDEDGKLKIDRNKINLAIYERLSLKLTKQLGVSQEQIDEILQSRNYNILSNSAKEYADEALINGLFTQLIPPHLISANGIQILSNAKEEYKPLVKKLLSEHMEVLKQQVERYYYDPSRTRFLENSLQTLITIAKKHVQLFGSLPSAMQIDDFKMCESELKKMSEQINQDLVSRAENKKTAKDSLNNYEKRAISIIEKMASKQDFEPTEVDAKFIADFALYAEGNKEFNQRLGKALKSDQNFVSMHKNVIKDLYKFTFKTIDNQKLYEKVEILNKYLKLQDFFESVKNSDGTELTNTLTDIKDDYNLKPDEETIIGELIKNPKLDLSPKHKAVLEGMINDYNLASEKQNVLRKLLDTPPLKLTPEKLDKIKEIINPTNLKITEQDNRLIQEIGDNFKIDLTEAEKSLLQESISELRGSQESAEADLLQKVLEDPNARLSKDEILILVDIKENNELNSTGNLLMNKLIYGNIISLPDTEKGEPKILGYIAKYKTSLSKAENNILKESIKELKKSKDTKEEAAVLQKIMNDPQALLNPQEIKLLEQMRNDYQLTGDGNQLMMKLVYGKTIEFIHKEREIKVVQNLEDRLKIRLTDQEKHILTESIKDLQEDPNMQDELKVYQKLLEDPNAQLSPQEKALLEKILTENMLTGPGSELMMKLTYGPIIEFTDEEKFVLGSLGNRLKLKENEKITLEEFGSMDRLRALSESKLYTVLNKCAGKFELKQVAELLKRIKETKLFSTNIVETAQRTTTVDVQSGDILMDHGTKFNKLYSSMNRGLKARLKQWITPYSHAAVGIAKPTGGMSISHVWGEYSLVLKASMLENALYQETFRVLPDMLVAPNLKKLLLECLDIPESELRKYLQKQYNDITNSLHKAENFEGATLYNSEEKRTRAGVADFIPSGHKGKKSNFEWADETLKDTKTLGQKLVGAGENIICSEFTAKMTVLALVALEKELIKQIQEKHPEKTFKTGELIKMPFKEFEDLSKVHPARLIKLLQNAKAVEKIEQKNVIQNMIRGA